MIREIVNKIKDKITGVKTAEYFEKKLMGRLKKSISKMDGLKSLNALSNEMAFYSIMYGVAQVKCEKVGELYPEFKKEMKQFNKNLKSAKKNAKALKDMMDEVISSD